MVAGRRSPVSGADAKNRNDRGCPRDRRPATSSARFDRIADLHRVTRGDDLACRRVALRCQDADLADNLSWLSGRIAIDRQEVSRLDLIVVAEVNLDEVAVRERFVPFLRVDNVAGGT